MLISFNCSRLFLVLLCFTLASAWNQDELELFDLIEEVNQNFYELLGLPQNCTNAEIRKSFRKLSLQLHPDKNDAEDAEVKFRQLVGVYEALKDDEKRKSYDRVLVEGLPSWRNPLYYYRRVRKMGMMELSIWLFVLFTIGQYFVAWGSYFERKLTLEQIKASALKKLQKQKKKAGIKTKNSEAAAEEVEEAVDKQFGISKPSVKNTLPFQIFRGIIGLPALVKWILAYREERRLEAEAEKERLREEAEELEREKEEMEREKERKATRRKRVIPLPEHNDDSDECILDGVDDPTAEVRSEPNKPPRISGGLWTDEDLAELARYMKKYPAGTMERWDKIAEALNRTEKEVIHFARKIKDNGFRPPEGNEGDQIREEERVERKKEKTRGGKNNILLAEPTQADAVEGSDEPQVAGSVGWSQKQQKSLETALACYTKGSAERWERIAKAVPGKTKEECMMRVKYISDMIKKKKEEEKLRQEQLESGESAAAVVSTTNDDDDSCRSEVTDDASTT